LVGTTKCTPLDFLPLWALFALTLALVLASIEAGYLVGTRRITTPERESQASVGAMASASLALLAFMLAFTFSFAASRLEARRTILLDEVNAIGTSYLRAATLPEPERSQARALLREYVDTRLEATRAARLDAALEHSEVLQGRLWDSAAALAARNPNSIIVGLYLETLNETIDLHAQRVNEGLRIRIPGVVWTVLFGLTVIAMAGMGYQTGLSGSRRPLASPGLALAFSVVMLLIAASTARRRAGCASASSRWWSSRVDDQPNSAPR
jgi:hypothetical protein